MLFSICALCYQHDLTRCGVKVAAAWNDRYVPKKPAFNG